LHTALKEGHIILVSLATEGGMVSDENARTFATLMLADLWTAAKERGKGKDNKPFYVTIDEFQNFVSPTIAENLDEARGFGLHLTLAHQFPSQLIEASREYGQRLYDSVMENARSKVVFSMATRERNLSPLADWLYMGTFDPYKIKHQLYSTKVMEYAEETRTVTSRGGSRALGRSDTRGRAIGGGSARTAATVVDALGSPLQSVLSDSQAASTLDTTAYGNTEIEVVAESESEVPMLIPIMGEELSSVQFLSLDEQRFEAEKRVMSQPNRHATARFVDMNVPVQLRTPEIKPSFIDEETTLEYRREQLAKWPFVLSYEDANERLLKRSASLALPLAGETEPVKYKRRVRVRPKTKTDSDS
ncbi:MAG: type IV secretory system conjugative DNA transfer family protein, partial [Acidobacteria bacterium]|nr:type IV secretory system conjugative DNA transfer family protein [Acidobacteriota bacterium]